MLQGLIDSVEEMNGIYMYGCWEFVTQFMQTDVDKEEVSFAPS